MFAYCKNNPIKLVDPNGDHSFIVFLFMYITAVMSSPDFQMDANNAMQSASQGDALGATLDVVSMGVPGVTGLGAVKRAAVESADEVVEVSRKVSNGRSGKQTKLRSLANDDKVSTALRGEIKRDINEIKRGQRTLLEFPKATN